MVLQRGVSAIRQVIPSATLYIVGKDPAHAVTQLADGDTVINWTCLMHGRLFTTWAWWSFPSELVAACVKILEAMALGKPVVSTSVGAEGIPVTPNRHLLIADTAQAFAQAVITLSESPSLRLELAQAGRGFVEANFSWTQLAKQMESICQTVIALGIRRREEHGRK